MKIVVTANCQRFGLATGLKLILGDTDIEKRTIPLDEDAWNDTLDAVSDADVWIAPRSVAATPFAQRIPAHVKVVRIPLFWFAAFHPDITYVKSAAGTYDCLGSSCHSKIVLWSWCNGLDPQAALALFNTTVFSRLGYFGQWEREVSDLRTLLAQTDIDFQRLWGRVQRRDGFMHTCTHPKSVVTSEIAKQIAVLLGESPSVFEEPIDHCIPDQINTTIWPVYPEIGALYGVSGMYRWKIVKSFYSSLSEYVHAAYADYDEQNIPASDLHGRVLEDERLSAVLRTCHRELRAA